MAEHPGLPWVETENYRKMFERRYKPKQFDLHGRLRKVPLGIVQTIISNPDYTVDFDSGEEIKTFLPIKIVGSKGYVYIEYALNIMDQEEYIPEQYSVLPQLVSITPPRGHVELYQSNKTKLYNFMEGRLNNWAIIHDFVTGKDHYFSKDNTYPSGERLLMSRKGFSQIRGDELFYNNFSNDLGDYINLGKPLINKYELSDNYIIYEYYHYENNEMLLTFVNVSTKEEHSITINGEAISSKIYGDKIYMTKEDNQGLIFVLDIPTKKIKKYDFQKLIDNYAIVDMITRDEKFMLFHDELTLDYYLYNFHTNDIREFKNYESDEYETNPRCVGMNEEGTFLYMTDKDGTTIRTYTLE